MKKEQREQMLDDIAKFCLMDDTFFHTCLKDSPSGMEWILRIILDDSELVVLEMHTQACVLDAMHVEKNMEWKQLPPTIVIFITETDALHGGEPIYHVERTIRELHHKRFEDDAEIIYVNGKCQDDTPLGRLMQDFACKDPAKMHSKVLAERVKFYKSDEHGVRTMCKIMQDLMEKYAEGKLEEGRAKGKAEGIAEKTLRTIRNQLKRHVEYADIASDNETTVDEVIRIAKENGLAY